MWILRQRWIYGRGRTKVSGIGFRGRRGSLGRGIAKVGSSGGFRGTGSRVGSRGSGGLLGRGRAKVGSSGGFSRVRFGGSKLFRYGSVGRGGFIGQFKS